MTTNDREATEEDAAAVADWKARLERLRYLYRYTGIRGERFAWFHDVVLRSLLYFPSFNDLNDPFDGRVRPTADGTPKEKRAFWEWSQFTSKGREVDAAARAEIERIVALPLPEAQRRMDEAHDEEGAKAGVVCFSEPRDDLALWAYYADSHRGACLRFRTDRLWNPPLEGCFNPAPVTYSEYPQVSFYRNSQFSRSTAMGWTKAECWSHEKEWRILRPKRGHEDERGAMRFTCRFDPAALDGIIIGCRMSDKDQECVRDVLARRDPKVELFKAHRAERFELDIRPAGE